MNREEATKFLALIKIAYPKAYRNMDADSIAATVTMWQNTFSDVPYVIMEMALDHFRKTSEFEPTVASIYKELKGLHYAALEDVMSSNNEFKVKLGRFVMEQTSRFRGDSDNFYKINYSNLSKLIADKENPLSEGYMQKGVIM